MQIRFSPFSVTFCPWIQLKTCMHTFSLLSILQLKTKWFRLQDITTPCWHAPCNNWRICIIQQLLRKQTETSHSAKTLNLTNRSNHKGLKAMPLWPWKRWKRKKAKGVSRITDLSMISNTFILFYPYTMLNSFCFDRFLTDYSMNQHIDTGLN